jgi:hypothetical protein
MTDRDEDTQPHASGAAAGGAVPPPPPGEPPLRADPDRPRDSGWREPPWFPPSDRRRDRPVSPFAMVVGLGLVLVGLYYFVDRTLGIALPRISWGSLWPILLIVLGGLILIRSFQRKP